MSFFKSLACCTKGDRQKVPAMEKAPSAYNPDGRREIEDPTTQATSQSAGAPLQKNQSRDKAKTLSDFNDLFKGTDLENCCRKWKRFKNTLDVPPAIRAEIALVERASDFSSDAVYCMGYFYQYGIGVESDDSHALEFYQTGRADGHLLSQIKEADFYRDGLDVSADLDRAFELYENACERKSPKAHAKFGDLYHHGKGVKKNFDVAHALYTEAAKQGYIKAAKLLQQIEKDIQEEKQNGGHNSDDSDSEEEDKGNQLSEVEQDERAAKAGDLEAQLRCGHRYKNGKDVPVAYEASVQYYQLAADQGSARAQMFLGIATYLGQGTEKDLTKAAYWFQKSADQGLARATFSLSELYRNGQGVKKDGKKAYQLAKVAAKKGMSDAEYSLGKFYMDGKTVRRDLVKAEKYFTSALAHKYKPAAKKLQALEKIKAKRLQKEQFKQKLLEEAPETAIQYFKQIIADNENDVHSLDVVDAYLTLAEHYKKSGNYQDAEAHLNKLLEVDKNWSTDEYRLQAKLMLSEIRGLQSL